MFMPIDTPVTVHVTVHDPATGGEVNADSTPTYSVYEDASTTAMSGFSAVAMTLMATGRYVFQYTPTIATGFEIGKMYGVLGRATVGGVTANVVAREYLAIPALTTGGLQKTDMVAISGNVTAAGRFSWSASVLWQSTVTSASTATLINDSALLGWATDHWKGRVVIFGSGSLVFQAVGITGSGSGTLTVATLTAPPTIGDFYVIV